MGAAPEDRDPEQDEAWAGSAHRLRLREHDGGYDGVDGYGYGSGEGHRAPGSSDRPPGDDEDLEVEPDIMKLLDEDDLLQMDGPDA